MFMYVSGMVVALNGRKRSVFSKFEGEEENRAFAESFRPKQPALMDSILRDIQTKDKE
jgi:hypothetical protein